MGQVRDVGQAAGVVKGFADHDELLSVAVAVSAARASGHQQAPDVPVSSGLGTLGQDAQGLAQAWHAAFEASRDELVFCSRCRAACLDATEREIVAAMVAERLGMIGQRIQTPRDLLEALGLRGGEVLHVMRAISPKGRLCQQGLMYHQDMQEDLLDRLIVVDPVLVEYMLEQGNARVGLGANSEEDLNTRS